MFLVLSTHLLTLSVVEAELDGTSQTQVPLAVAADDAAETLGAFNRLAVDEDLTTSRDDIVPDGDRHGDRATAEVGRVRDFGGERLAHGTGVAGEEAHEGEGSRRESGVALLASRLDG